MLNYIDLKYKPTKTDLICEFYVEPNNMSLQKAAEHIAAESSIGTWTELTTMRERIAKKLKPKVFFISAKTGEIKIAYPQELFEAGNMPQILSAVAGNIFGMKSVRNLRLQDIHFPKKVINSFLGPAFGIRGIRNLLRVKDRPLLGTIVKPKVGLSPEQHAHVAYNAWLGGLDIVKDDENLTSMRFNLFEERITKVLELRDRAEEETGEKKIYMPNITAETDIMIHRADYLKRQGCEYAMLDILTVGWSALQTFRKLNLGLVIHAHRAGHAATTRNKRHGISMLTIAKIARLIGVDQIHIGTAIGKMEGSPAEVEDIEEEIESSIVNQDRAGHILEQKWYHIKPVLAVCSGGLHPGLVPRLIKIMGNNIVAQFGGGCHGHPDGTYAGAIAIRQALDAAIQNVPIKEYAKHHQELSRAIEKWGY